MKIITNIFLCVLFILISTTLYINTACAESDEEQVETTPIVQLEPEAPFSPDEESTTKEIQQEETN